MPGYNFKERFASMIESGDKRQTIRAIRKDGWVPKVGSTAYCYTGMRTKKCRKLGEFKIKSVHSIKIGRYGYSCVSIFEKENSFKMERFAKADGFDTWEDLTCFFIKTHALPFRGLLIKW
ncbi:MAG: hypothetical protein KAI70_00540 [Candidatus Omnitrophica bacterium]|nr:hypothetical protein [Candidatus Omnitrophota bacterium]